MDILRPECLWFALLLPLLWHWHRRSLSPLRGRRRTASFVLRAAVAIALVLALSEPRWKGTTTRQEILLLVDQSASVRNAAVTAAEDFLRKARFDDADKNWIGFAGKGRVFPSLEELRKADPGSLSPGETRIDGALGLAVAGFRPGRVRTVVLFSDGVNTGAPPPWNSLKDQGVRVHVVPVTLPDRPEVLVHDVRAPASVRRDEPLRIEATIQSTRDTPARASLFRNGVRISSRETTLRPGGNKIAFEDRAGEEKLLHYEVAVEAKEDTISENNQSGAAVLCEGPSKVLLVTDKTESARYLEWALRQEGIALGVRPQEGMPSQMSDLQNHDAVIMDNIPASALSRGQMELLQSYVRDFGGGLLMLGGDQAYGLGGYFRTPVEDVLPVSCDFQKEEESPSLGLALVIDRSGSMSGEKLELAKAAAKASADLLGPKDFVSVIAFDSESHPILPIQSAGNSSGIAAAIASITEGGGTNMAPAMEEALRQLSGNDAKIKHVILLTDGVSQPGPFYELTSEMTREKITVSTVGVGEGADSELLGQIAQWGNGRFYETNDPSTVPQIFTKETMTASKSAIQEFPFLAKPVRAVDFLEGVPWTEAPFLLGYVRTKPKSTSETWLLTERGDPLLTTWRYGLGTTGAFTSDARNRWAVEWLRWPGFGKFWAQLLRKISRPSSLGLSETEISTAGSQATIVLNALDPDALFPTETSGTLKISTPAGRVLSLPMEKTMPGQWVARFPSQERGVYSGQILLEKNGERLDSKFFTLSRGCSQEYLLEPADTRFLETLASETGGSVSPDPSTVFHNEDRTAPVEHELWPWLLVFALLTFTADVGIRRWPA